MNVSRGMLEFRADHRANFTTPLSRKTRRSSCTAGRVVGRRWPGKRFRTWGTRQCSTWAGSTSLPRLASILSPRKRLLGRGPAHVLAELSPRAPRMTSLCHWHHHAARRPPRGFFPILAPVVRKTARSGPHTHHQSPAWPLTSGGDAVACESAGATGRKIKAMSHPTCRI